MTQKRLFFLICLGWLGLSCNTTQAPVLSSLRQPSDIAVGGLNSQWAFVADRGADAVQLLELGTSLQDIGFARAPTQYFPLRIATGPNPIGLVSSGDGSYVVVVHDVIGSLAVIDARGERPLPLVDDNGERYFLNLESIVGSAPVSVAGRSASCSSEECTDRFYFSHRQGELSEVELLSTGRLRFSRQWTFPQSASGLALSSDAQTVYLSSGSLLYRLRLSTGAVSQLDLGTEAGVLQEQGGVVIVSRPIERDVVVVDGETLSVRDASAPGVKPACVNPCSDLSVCGNERRLAEQAICSDGMGGIQAVDPYTGIYIGDVASTIFFVGQSAGHPEIAGRSCIDDETSDFVEQNFSDMFGVVGRDGLTRFVAVQDESGPVARLIESESFCDSTAIDFIEPTQGSAADIIDIFGACPQLPDDDRFECLCLNDNCDAGLGWMRAEGASARVNIAWEGVLANRSTGGGAIDSEGRFFDRRREDLSAIDIQAGDILEILSQPIEGCSLEGAQACELEREIVELVDEGGGALVLDSPLDIDCFEEGSIAYRVRAGNTFLFNIDSVDYRLDSEGIFGPGSVGADLSTSKGATSGLLFSLKALSPPTGGACERLEAEAPFVRNGPTDSPFGLRIDDPYLPASTGYRVGTRGQVSSPAAGVLPSGSVVVEGSEPTVLVSFSGISGTRASILAFSPFDLALVPAPESVSGQGDFSASKYVPIR